MVLQIATRDTLDLLSNRDRRDVASNLVGQNVAVLAYDLQDRIAMFHEVLRHEEEKAIRNNEMPYFYKVKKLIGDQLAELIKMSEALVKQQAIVVRDLALQEDLDFALGILAEAGYRVIPDRVYKAYQEQLDEACEDHWQAVNVER
jgi:hypothetical protein